MGRFKKLAVAGAAAIMTLAGMVTAQTPSTDWYNNDPNATAFTISSADELAGLAELVNNGVETFAGKTITLDSDIDLGHNMWTPIGRSFSYSFMGTFDGNGKTISGLYLQSNNAGLFGYIRGVPQYATSNGTQGETHCDWGAPNEHGGGSCTSIESDEDWQTCFNWGSFVGDCDGGVVPAVNAEVKNLRIENVSAGGWYNRVGGIAGQANGNVSITNCFVSGSISGGYEVGGIVGYAGTFGVHASINITNTYTAATVYAGYGYNAGGLIGQARVEFAELNIVGNYVTGSIDANSESGGLIGYFYTGMNATLATININNNAVLLSNVGSGSSSGSDVGRIVGNGSTLNIVASNNYVFSGIQGSFTNTLGNYLPISKNDIASDGTINGLFVAGPVGDWEVEDGKLPGLAAWGWGTVDMPRYLDPSLVTVTFNNGYGGMVGTTITTANTLFDAENHDDPIRYSREGYTNAGFWHTKTGEVYTPLTNGTITVTHDTTLYLKWSLDDTYYEVFASGSGTDLDPYIISNDKQLAYLAMVVNNGESGYVDAHYKLADDITISSNYAPSNSAFNYGYGWKPIGNDYNSFYGVFDGNGKVISGLVTNNYSSYQGLFGYIIGGTVKNLGIEGALIYGYYNIGIVTGYIYSGNIENCYVTGTIDMYNRWGFNIGGIAGYTYDSKITDCYSAADVRAASSNTVGGVVGELYYSSVENCYATGEVRGEINVGGIVGNVNYNASVENSAALNSSVNGNSVVGRVAGSEYYGGFSDNFAFKGMIGSFSSSAEGAATINGESLSKIDINADGTLGGMFTNVGGVWSVTNGKLPGLFGNVVDMPEHLDASSFRVSFDLRGGAGPSLTYMDVTPNGTISAGNMPLASSYGKNGYVAKENSWYMDRAGTVKFVPGTTTVDDDITLYLVWVLDGTWYAEFTQGDGSENDPYIIENEKQLAYLALVVNEGDQNYNDKYYKLDRDLNLSAYGVGTAFNGGKGWVPIGENIYNPNSGWSYNLFRGGFDGNGKVIRGLSINDNQREYVGLFGYVQGDELWGCDPDGNNCGYKYHGWVKNLGVEDASIVGSNVVGIIVGVIEYSNATVTSCYTTGTVNGYDNIGGIAGYVKYGNITNSYSTATVGGNYYVGGIVGYVELAWSSATITISNNYFAGTVTGNNSVGGVAGSVYGYYNYYYGGGINISGNAALSSNVTASEYNVGRVVGYASLWESGHGISLSDNLAFDGMSVSYDYGNVYTPTDDASGSDGADISKVTITGDGTINGLFTGPVWVTEDGKLPNLAIFGGALELPGYLNSSRVVLTFDRMDGNAPPAPIYVTSGETVNGDGLYAQFPDAIGHSPGNANDGNWYYDNGGTDELFDPMATVVNGDMTLYLKWAPGIDDNWYEYVDVGVPQPVIISNAKQLAYVAMMISNGAPDYQDASYMLAGNIDLSTYGAGSVFNGGKGWIPIGNDYWNCSFGGVFDGGEYVISGLYINDDDRYMAGLFGYVNNGTIKNLGVEGAYVFGRENIGIIVGDMSYGSIENSYVTGTVGSNVWTNNTGGVVGSVEYSSITNCYSTANVFADNGGYSIGGIVGSLNWGQVVNCYAVGEVSINQNYSSGQIGGIVGHSWNGAVENSAALNPSITAAGYNVGRVVGNNYGSLSANIANGGMIGNFSSSATGDDTENGETMSRTEISAGGDIGDLFSDAVWTTAAGKLPGLFGSAVNMPAHLIASEYIVSFNVNANNLQTGSAPPPITVAIGGTIPSVQKPNASGITRMGFVNDGKWYVDVAGTTEFEFGTTVVSGDMTLYLKWNVDDQWLEEVTIASPTIITNAKQLAYVAMMINDGDTDFASADYRLENDIDISAYNASYNGGQGWLPIGTIHNVVNPFAGEFDGNGKVISGLWINSGYGEQGLFGYIIGGSVKNLGVDGASVLGYANVGIIAGWIVDGSIENCNVTGTVYNNGGWHNNSIGGIVGGVNNGRIINSYSAANVRMDGYYTGNIGGIAGYMSQSNVENCYTIGEVIGHYNVGGIVGYADWNSTIENSAALNPSVTAYGSDVGRIVGSIYATTLSANVAFDAMTLTESGSPKPPTSDDEGIDGEDITKIAVNEDGTIGGRFDAPIWVTADGKLPGHLAVQPMPSHLQIFSSATVVLAAGPYYYDGSDIEPEVLSVTLAGVTLVAGTDYTVSYEDNVDVGTGKVIITGAGTYAGSSVTETFTIEKMLQTAPAAFTLTSVINRTTGKFTVTIPEIPGVEYSFDGTTYGTTRTVTADPGDVVTGYMRKPEDATHNVSPATSASLTMPAVYTVTFSETGTPANGTLSATSGGAAIVSGDYAEADKPVVFTAAPSANYRVKDWTGVTGATGTGNTRTFSTLSGALTVSVEFEVIPPTPPTPPAFVAVTNITSVPTTVSTTTPVTLTGTVAPTSATNKTIVWSVKTPDTTGATITNGVLSVTSSGTVTVIATIANGTAVGTAFVKEFTLTATAPSSIATDGREVPGDMDMNGVAVPQSVMAAEFTVGPNPVPAFASEVRFYRTGKRAENATLTVYDALGNAVAKVAVSDKARSGDQSKREVGKWDLKNDKGIAVPAGTYLVKGAVKTLDGKRERVSIIISVR